MGGVATALTVAAVLLFGNLIGYGADVRKSLDAMPATTTDVEETADAPAPAAGVDAASDAGATTAHANTVEYMPPWAVNEDYCCDLIVPDSDIVFPVVKGSDNTKYLTCAFTGEESEIGSIFMDYRCNLGETPHTIIYGHDAQDIDGSAIMFGTLRNYLDQEFIDTHMELDLVCKGETKRFELFAVKVTDSSDEAYDLVFSAHGGFDGFAKAMGAPDGTREILTLSTCLGEGGDRLLVQGAIV